MELEETAYWISTHTGSADSDEKDIETSVEISALVHGETLKQVRGLVKRRNPDKTKYVSVTHDTTEMEQTEAVLRAFLIITAIGVGVGGAVCAIFLAAVCEGDIGCYDTPENLCGDLASPCDDPWLN